MALPLYLALTAAEFQNCSSIPQHMAWMACHYSPYGLGLSNCPRSLPQGSMLILNDRTPPSGHDPEKICAQLTKLVDDLKCSSVLLDFQRPNFVENAAVAKVATDTLSCPVGVSELYAKPLTCPVFLPPIPLTAPAEEYLSPWQGREVWLEAALGGEIVTVTESGAVFEPVLSICQSNCSLLDDHLHCHYEAIPEETRIKITLWRSAEDLAVLLQDAEKHGVTNAVGLYQELSRI